MAKRVSVADAKREFSEIMSRVALKNERFIIERKGKPMAALINLKDLEKVEAMPEGNGKKGLLAAMDAWEDYPQLERLVVDIYSSRQKSRDRRVKSLK
ncbi:MAG: type II toxin-antitoxin system Phd/YefM family antitoxin [Nitrospirae bacterium]|nr:type II toxin-antitoxin system Phd/YefM family antitoxin [Nitrospirota bacterium]